ncbi:MAG: helix-turn-helix transcriptional regulator [Spirochaetales bacterium]|nr:helix-turn-helix transcriptional regulator [Spirochaetales bacterium]
MKEKKETTKEKIFREAVNLFAAKGYHGTSMRELAAAAGIKESSVYNHFKGKEAILDAILDYQMSGFNGAGDALDELKGPLDTISDPVQFWLAGASLFLTRLPPLNREISRILINEMYLIDKCRTFYLHILRPVKKNLTATILSVMRDKKMIKDCDIEKTAEQYVYFLEGMGIEHNLMMMEGVSQDEINKRTLEQVSLFIERLKK